MQIEYSFQPSTVRFLVLWRKLCRILVGLGAECICAPAQHAPIALRTVLRARRFLAVTRGTCKSHAMSFDLVSIADSPYQIAQPKVGN